MKDTDIAVQKEHDVEAEENQIRDYLDNHTDFFERNQDLLQTINLPHQTGKAVSLVERQVDLLRNRARDADRRLGELISVARDNEQLFEKTRSLTLALLDAGNLEELSQILEDGFREDFQTDAGGLILLVDEDGDAAGNTRTLSRQKLGDELSRFADLKEASGGALREEEADVLFPLHDNRIQSVMVAPVFLRNQAEDTPACALLALGSTDRGYFHDRLGTSFLEYIRQVLGRILVLHLPEDH